LTRFFNSLKPVIGPPRPPKTKVVDFLDELLWLATYVGDERFYQADIAVLQSGAIKDRKWAEDFHILTRSDCRAVVSRNHLPGGEAEQRLAAKRVVVLAVV
jgi:hypothetical protein